MLDDLDALAALARAKTMTRAATELRISQSAVSKRIASLEERTGADLVEPAGRCVRLTEAGERLLARTMPLVAELRRAVDASADSGRAEITLGVSESILSSWGPSLLAAVRRRLPALALQLHAHRGPVAVERVRAGEYTAALIAGEVAAADLATDDLGREEMVLVGAGRLRRPCTLDILTVERASTTWPAIERELGGCAEAGITLRVVATVESFAAVIRLAQSGFGIGLAPRGLAEALAPGAVVRLPPPRLSRPIRLCYHKSARGRPVFDPFRAHIARALRGRRGLRC